MDLPSFIDHDCQAAMQTHVNGQNSSDRFSILQQVISLITQVYNVRIILK